MKTPEKNTAPLLLILLAAILMAGNCHKQPTSAVTDTEKPVISLLDTANNSQNSITFIFGLFQ